MAAATEPLQDLVDASWATIWDAIADLHPSRTAVVSPNGELTYRDLEDRAARLAGWLQSHGISRGSRIAIYLYNRPEYLVMLYAAFKLGAVPVNINFRYKADELRALLDISEAEILLYPSSQESDAVQASLASASAPRLIVVPDGPSPAAAEATRFQDACLAERVRDVSPSGEDEIYIFTGGTTGTPRAVVWLHRDLFDSQRVSIYSPLGVSFPGTLQEIVDIAALPELPSPVTLPITPLMHAMAMFNTMNTLVLGGTVVFMDSPSFDPARTLAVIAERRVTRVIIAGNAIAAPLADELDKARDAGSPYDVSSVQIIMSSGMRWSDQAKAALLHHFDARLFDIVGSSEGGPYAYSSVWSEDDLPSKLTLAQGAVVLDVSGEELTAPGSVGVLAYRGPMPLGYHNDPAKTAESYRVIGGRRYVSPGDYVRLLGDRRIEFLGRSSGVINTGGEKVFPGEVEEAILELGAVEDCTVTAVDDERWGQVVGALIVLHPGAELSDNEIAAHLSERLAGYKKPRRIAIVPSLRRSPSGKLNPAALRDLVSSHLTPQPKGTTS